MPVRDKRTATDRKIQVLMFYLLGKKIRETLGGWSPPLVRPRFKTTKVHPHFVLKVIRYAIPQ